MEWYEGSVVGPVDAAVGADGEVGLSEDPGAGGVVAEVDVGPGAAGGVDAYAYSWSEGGVDAVVEWASGGEGWLCSCSEFIGSIGPAAGVAVVYDDFPVVARIISRKVWVIHPVGTVTDRGVHPKI